MSPGDRVQFVPDVNESMRRSRGTIVEPRALNTNIDLDYYRWVVWDGQGPLARMEPRGFIRRVSLLDQIAEAAK